MTEETLEAVDVLTTDLSRRFRVRIPWGALHPLREARIPRPVAVPRPNWAAVRRAGMCKRCADGPIHRMEGLPAERLNAPIWPIAASGESKLWPVRLSACAELPDRITPMDSRWRCLLHPGSHR